MKTILKPLMNTAIASWRMAFIGLALVVVAGCSKESKIEGHLKKGDTLYAEGDYEKARIEYLNVTRLSPTNAHAFAQIGNIFYESGLMLKAGAFLSRAIEMGDEDPRVLARRAILLAMGDKEKARQDASAALKQDPTQEEAILLLADLANDEPAIEILKTRLAELRQANGNHPVYDTAEAVMALKLRDIDGAERLLKAVAAEHPQFAPSQFILGSIYLSRSNLVDAEAAFARAAELSPPRSNRQMRYIDFLLKKDKETGKARISEILDQAPDYIPARIRLAQIAFAEKDYDAVRKEISSIVSRDPQNIESRQLEAQMYLAMKELDKAQEIMRDLLKLYPGSAQLWYQAALTSIAKNDADRSLDEIEKAYAISPKLPQVVLLRARLLMLKQRSAEAVDSIEQFVADSPSYKPGYLQLADALLRNDETGRALAVYRDYEQRFADDPRGSYLQGTVLVKLQKPTDARAAFERTLAITKSFFPATEQLALLDIQEEKFTEAIERVTDYVELNPKDAMGHLMLGRAHIAAKDFPNAETSLETAIAENPELQSAYYLLVQVYNETDRKEEAADKLRELLTTKPTDLRALMTLAIIETKDGEFQAAADKYETLIAANPDFSPALNNLAYLYSEQLSDLDRAYQLARKAQQLLPDDPKVGDTLGWILYHRKEYNQALVHLEESAAKLTGIGEVQYHLGMALYRSGREPRAMLLLKKSLNQNDSDDAWADDAREGLNVLELDISKQDPQVLAQLEQLAGERADDVIVITRLAQVQEALGKTDLAMASYKQASQLAPLAVTPLIGQARIHLAQGNSVDALNLVRKARDASDNDAAAAAELGRIAYYAKDYLYSYALLQDAINKMASDDAAQASFARSAIAIGHLDPAKASLQKVAAAAGGALKDVASLDLKLIMAAEGRSINNLPADVRTAIDSDGDGPLNRFVRIRIIAANGENIQAIAEYKKLLEDFPQFAPAMKQLSIELIKNSATVGDAEKWARKARETLSSDAELSKVLGEAAFTKKDYRYAANVLGAASRQLPDDAGLFLLLAQSQAELKQVAQAKTSINRALALPLSPKEKQTAEALSKSLANSQ